MYSVRSKKKREKTNMRQNNFFKRQLCKVCCVAMLLSTVAVTGGTQEAQAASKTEIETYGTTLILNQTATGVLSADDEQDWYIFNITERGYFTINFRRNDSADTDKINEGWKCSLYSEDGSCHCQKGVIISVWRQLIHQLLMIGNHLAVNMMLK